MTAALTRRKALAGAAAAALGVGASTAPTRSPAKGLSPGSAFQSTTLGPNDARLIALADEYAAVDDEVNRTPSTAPGFDALVERFHPLEIALAETPADGVPGLVAKARALQVKSLRDAGFGDVPLSLADDVHRLFGGGAA